MTGGADSLRWDPGVERMIALSRGAHRGVDQRDDLDYWYRLGQGDAYAFAAALVLARGVDSHAFAVSEPVTGALSDGVTELGELRDAAWTRGTALPTPTWRWPGSDRSSSTSSTAPCPASSWTTGCAGEATATSA